MKNYLMKYLKISKVNEIVFRLRFIWYFRIKKNFKYVKNIGADTLDVEKSLNEMQKGVSNHRPKNIVLPLNSIAKKNKENSLVLSVGSRYETEILYLKGIGFKNVRGLDLFSYSPWIDVGDMHDMPYEENTFDVMTLGWIVSYSDNIKLLKNEIIRCCKDGAIISIGVSAYTKELFDTYHTASKKENNLTQSIEKLDTSINNLNSNIIPDREKFETRIQTVEQFRDLFKGNINSELYCKNPYFKAEAYEIQKDYCIYIFSLKK